MPGRSRKRGERGSPRAVRERAPRRSGAERDEEIRAQLTPLAPGERPRPLLIATAVAAALGLGNLVAYALGTKIGGSRPSAASIAGFCGLMLIAAWGMWNRRYWAVLGFQTLLATVTVVFFLFGLRAASVLDVVIALGVVVPSGWLFWKLVRVLARIQTPAGPDGSPQGR